ncbi:sensor histidine kinase [Curtobacterium ammoniigenes]|uniref:sensor histidine kinase n=1 Tax=Curtobacterium ammoniigenes TaxID=395387 RepID=UPI000831D962|nr:HAMP domain-containing sensor histidine kinase [Curtobacterium ammoniigenes]
MALLAVTLVLATGAVFARASIVGARDQLRAQATAQLRVAIATEAFGGSLPSGATTDPSVVPRPLLDAIGSNQVETYDDGADMWAARAQHSGVIATRLPDTPIVDQWRRLEATFAIGGLLAAVVAASVSWIVAGRLTARLRATSRTVNDVITGRAEPALSGNDEVAVLTRGLAETAAALASRLDRERAVTADVAHDLKTPLTALVSAATLLPPSAEAARVQRLVARLRALVEDLLRLARTQHEDVGPGVERPLADAIAAAVRSAECADAVVWSDGGTRDSPPDRTFVTDAPQGHIDRIVANLVQNACRHGRGDVRVTVAGSAVMVADAGDGFPESLLAGGPRRFGALGAQAGSGLGLAIVAHHVDAIGAVLELENTQHGALATVRFPHGQRGRSLR